MGRRNVGTRWAARRVPHFFAAGAFFAFLAGAAAFFFAIARGGREMRAEDGS